MGRFAWIPHFDSSIGTIEGCIERADGELVCVGRIGGGLSRPMPAIARWGTRPTTLDFNNDGVSPDTQDIIDFINVLGGAWCASCLDTDFNDDGVSPDMQDFADFVYFFSGGIC
jgi:hypothetical protein